MKSSEVGDSIHGHRIIAEARKVSDTVVIVKKAGHKALGNSPDRECIGHN